MSKITLNSVSDLTQSTTAQTTINANSSTVQTAFDNTLSRDGTSPNQMGASLDMNSNQIINLPVPSTQNSPARLIDVVSNPTIVVPGTGTSGHVVPFLDGNNTFSGTELFNGNVTFGGTVSGLPSSISAPSLPEGRLTLTSGVAITASDVSGATTLYYTPVIGRFIPLWNGSTYVMTDTGGEISLVTTDATKSPAAVAANKVYYVLVWSDSGTIRVSRSPAWVDDVTPGTGAGTAQISLVNGFWTNTVAITNGPGAGLGTVVGAIRANSSAQLQDAQAFRWVSNIYNQDQRVMRVLETANTWTQTNAINTYRQANANSANQLDWLQALDGGTIEATVMASFNNSTTASSTNYGIVGVDIDTLNTGAVTNLINGIVCASLAGAWAQAVAVYSGKPGKGRHIAIWKELHANNAGGVSTWLGVGSLGSIAAGISGKVWA